ncbi:glycogen debranching protein [filamentous cyanobacterium CCP5]|nr:glycogen debranching protein [filamentous cyanobacterium CCP5]
MGLQFGRDICGNLATAEKREWLVTNGIGGYALQIERNVMFLILTLILLVAALKPPLARTLLVTKLDEQITYGGQTYDLFSDRRGDGTVTPEGYRQIEDFTLNGSIPTWTFAFGDALLKKCIWMEPGTNTTYIRYSLKRGSQPMTLSLKALVNYRNHHHSSRADDWQMAIQPVTGGIEIKAFAGAHPYCLVADQGDCTPQHTWYCDYDLAIERYRGIDSRDDHLHAATFERQLQPGEFMTLAASTEAPDAIQFEGAIQRRRGHDQRLLGQWYSAAYLQAKQAPLWIEQLVLAADQFVVGRSRPDQSAGKTVIAGYPWFGDWGRDTMIALPGLTVATGQPELARPILRTFAQYLDQGMLPNLFPEAGETPEYNTVDAILWYFEAIRVYFAATGDRQLLEELFPALAEMIRWHQRGTRYHIHLDADGLIYAGEPGAQLTWMDAKVGDWVVTPRIGKPIEVNALWYNALLIMVQVCNQLGQPAEAYHQLAAHTRIGFQRFWQPELGYCADVIDGPEGSDLSLRPNQIFAVALPGCDRWQGLSNGSQLTPETLGPPLLSAPQQQAVIDTVARRLLTSYGLRSLAPDHPNYRGRYGGDPVQRDGSYHQGTVWGWLIGPFVQAHLKVYQNPVIARSFLEPMAMHLQDGCVGSLSEIFDGDAPFTPRGAFAQAWTVAEVLRAWSLTSSGAHLR